MKRFNIFLVVISLAFSLCACNLKNVATTDSNSNTTVDNEVNKQQKLSISCNDDEQLIVKIQDESVKKLLKATDSDTTFNIYFYSSEGTAFELNIWNDVNQGKIFGVIARFNENGSEPEWYFDTSKGDTKVTDDLLTLTFNEVGICSTIKGENAQTYDLLFLIVGTRSIIGIGLY